MHTLHTLMVATSDATSFLIVLLYIPPMQPSSQHLLVMHSACAGPCIHAGPLLRVPPVMMWAQPAQLQLLRALLPTRLCCGLATRSRPPAQASLQGQAVHLVQLVS